MSDLLVITPIRARKESALRLINAMRSACTAQTDLAFAIDDDDHTYDDVDLSPALVIRGPQQTCPAWTNTIAMTVGQEYRALASLGDDHIPLTLGWDSAMLAALADMGGTGIVYGDDLLQHENLPTAPVISTNIVQALGWMMYPECKHFYCDNVWKDLARRAGCLRYLPSVVIQHLHYSVGTAERDETYATNESSWAHDERAYWDWTLDPSGLAANADLIIKLRNKP